MYSYSQLSRSERGDSDTPSWFAVRPCWGLFVCVAVLLVVVTVLWFVVPGITFLPDPAVQTACGVSHGYIHNTTHVYVFKGIGYTAPPTGQHRWQAPVPAQKGNCANRDSDPPPCVQRDPHNKSAVMGSEDCLYLNIFSPHISPWVAAPVLVWIHGGEFMSGSVSQPHSSPDPELAKTLGAVIVSVQYRLNVFGWLVSETLPHSGGHVGNYGLLDQIEALTWIQNNIHAFGGDPEQVTLLGHGSGGTSSLLLMNSPLAHGLFHGVVSLSAGPHLAAATYVRAREQNQRLMTGQECQDAACMLALSAEDAFNIIAPAWERESVRYDFPQEGSYSPDLVVVDGITLPGAPSYEWDQADLMDIPVLLGSTAQEVDLRPAPGQQLLNWSKPDLHRYLQTKLTTFQRPALTANHSLLLYDADEAEEIFTSMVTDIRVTCLTNVIANKMAARHQNGVYRYVLTAVPSSPVVSGYSAFPARLAFHGYDIAALFNKFDLVLSAASESDYRLGDELRGMVKMFIEKGTVDWGRLPQEIALIARDGIQTVASYHDRECKYWRENGLLDHSWVN